MASDQRDRVEERQNSESASQGTNAHGQQEFIVIIRGYNCEKTIGKCLDSLRAQTHPYWNAMVVLDAPTDNSANVTRPYVNDKHDKRIRMLINDERKGLCFNMWFSIKFAASILRPTDETIFAFLDADDWLAPEALQKHAKVYRKYPDTLVTHGSYIKVSKSRRTKISKPYPKHGKVRKLPWKGSHLKACKWAVLKHIEPEWFQHKGQWLDAASDLALMFGVIDIAGLEHTRHVHSLVYYWRDHMTKRKAEAQMRCERIQRAK